MTKKCIICQEIKSFEEFSKKSRNKDKLSNKCKKCTSIYMRQRYENNANINLQHQAFNKIRAERNRKFLYEYLKAHPCVDCGETDTIVLEFDHIKGDKEYTVSMLVGKSYSLEKIEKEIAKCEVRCANCHRRKTCDQLLWHKSTMLPNPQP